MARVSRVFAGKLESEVINTVTPLGQSGQYCGHCLHELPSTAKRCCFCSTLPRRIVKRVPQEQNTICQSDYFFNV